MRFDLQSHSICSDGTLTPAAVVARAAQAGIELLALTDHDTVDGVTEALEAAQQHDLRLVPAAELSSVSGEFSGLDICGYGLRHDDLDLIATLADFRADRGRRIWTMADRLEELGFTLAREELEARDASGASLGRPHLANAVLSHPDNFERLATEGIAGKEEMFPAYLVPGASAYVERSRPTPEEAIAVIHRAGGVAVWAHPFLDIEDPADVSAAIERFAAAGLDGVEVFYVTHDEAQTRHLHREATGRGLLATGSSDFHGPERKGHDGFGLFELYGLAPQLGPIAEF